MSSTGTIRRESETLRRPMHHTTPGAAFINTQQTHKTLHLTDHHEHLGDPVRCSPTPPSQTWRTTGKGGVQGAGTER